MVDEKTKEKILKYFLRGYPERKIKERLELSDNDFEKSLSDIKSDITHYSDHDAARYYVNETFATLSHLEHTLWKEFEDAMPGSMNRIRIVKMISDLRKDGVNLREKLNKFVVKPQKAIPDEIIKKLPQRVKMTVAEIFVDQLEDLQSLPEPTPPDQIELDMGVPLMLSSTIEDKEE